MNDDELHSTLELLGFVKEHQGGGTNAYVNGNIVVSGADCDLPSEHWYCVAIYKDWQNGDIDCDWSRSDYSGVAENASLGDGARDILADVQEALQIGKGGAA